MIRDFSPKQAVDSFIIITIGSLSPFPTISRCYINVTRENLLFAVYLCTMLKEFGEQLTWLNRLWMRRAHDYIVIFTLTLWKGVSQCEWKYCLYAWRLIIHTAHRESVQKPPHKYSLQGWYVITLSSKTCIADISSIWRCALLLYYVRFVRRISILDNPLILSDN